MATDIDTTTLSTLDLLEARLLRIEHLLYGHVVQQPKTPAFKGMGDLEHHFAKLLHGVRVYAELLKICMCCALFQSAIHLPTYLPTCLPTYLPTYHSISV